MIWGAERCMYIYVATGERQPDELTATLCNLWMRMLYPDEPR